MKDERTLQMEQNFMVLHNEGKTIKEIAAMFDLSTRSIYGRLGEIAKANGVSRESLLERPHPEHVLCKKSGSLRKAEPVNPDEIYALFGRVANEMGELQSVIKKAVKKVQKKVNEEERIWNVELSK